MAAGDIKLDRLCEWLEYRVSKDNEAAIAGLFEERSNFRNRIWEFMRNGGFTFNQIYEALNIH